VEARQTMSESERRWRVEEEMRRAHTREAAAVERLYSTKPRRVILGTREYVIPANYFGPKQKDRSDTRDATKSYFGFFLFLPDYDGYTRDNWQDDFDPRLIRVLQVSMVDKNEVVFNPELGHIRVPPAGYGDPTAQFQNIRGMLEETPSLHAYDLQGYRPKHGGGGDVTWVGTRSNGEFFFFESRVAPGQAAPKGSKYPSCDVRYYSEKEDLFIAYLYSNDHLAKWREIDDAIWAKLHKWQVK
jgi:hypothetical protein